jgi:hypothetical protein
MTAREALPRLADRNRKFACVSLTGCSYSESAAKYRFSVESPAIVAATDAVRSLRCECGIFMMTARRMAALARRRDPCCPSGHVLQGSEDWTGC